MISAALPALAIATLAVVLAACGASDGTTSERPAAAAPATARPAATATAPAAPADGSALARNAADANRLVGDGAADLKARLAALRGHPVVVNQWASWCGPCRLEFPFFAAAVRRHAARVAFVGVNALDSRDGAQGFLDAEPPGFASVFDKDGKAARAIGGGPVMPTTLFIGPDGRTRHAKLGGYADASELEADIRRYALGSPP